MSTGIAKLASTQVGTKANVSKPQSWDILGGVKLTNPIPELGPHRASNPLTLTDQEGNTRSLNLGLGRREDFEFGGLEFSVDDRALRVNDMPFDPSGGYFLSGKSCRATGRATGVDPSGYSFHEAGRVELSGGQALSYERGRDSVRQANIHSPDLERPVGIEIGIGIESEVKLNGRTYASKNGELRIDDRRFDFKTGELEKEQHGAQMSGYALPGESQFRERPESHRVSHRVALAYEGNADPTGDRRFEVQVDGWDKPFVLHANPADSSKDGELRVANHHFLTKNGQLFVDGQRFEPAGGRPSREHSADTFVRSEAPPRLIGEAPRSAATPPPVAFPALSIAYDPARGMFMPRALAPGFSGAPGFNPLMNPGVLAPMLPLWMAQGGAGMSGISSALNLLFPGLGFMHAFMSRQAAAMMGRPGL